MSPQLHSVLQQGVTTCTGKTQSARPLTYMRWWQQSCWLSRCCPREAPGWTGLPRRWGWCCAGRWPGGRLCTPDRCFWWTDHLRRKAVSRLDVSSWTENHLDVHGFMGLVIVDQDQLVGHGNRTKESAIAIKRFISHINLQRAVRNSSHGMVQT